MQKMMPIGNVKGVPKYRQIVESISRAILCGHLRKGDQVFSINELSEEYLLCRVTVQKAYNILRQKGILTAVPGKGFYVSRTDLAAVHRIVLFVESMNDHTGKWYQAFAHTLGSSAAIELRIHQDDPLLFRQQLAGLQLEYDHYIVIPPSSIEPEVLQEIPADKLILVDQQIMGLRHSGRMICPDLRSIGDALEAAGSLLRKYARLTLVQHRRLTTAFSAAIRNYCLNNAMPFRVLDKLSADHVPIKGDAYLLASDHQLVDLLQSCRKYRLDAGKDLGILSLSDSVLKEALLNGITVLTTDAAQMGVMMAGLVLDHQRATIRIPVSLIARSSL